MIGDGWNMNQGYRPEAVVDTYYRDRILRAEVEAENVRARRFAALDEALTEVLNWEASVLDQDEHAALIEARAVVQDLRRTW